MSSSFSSRFNAQYPKNSFDGFMEYFDGFDVRIVYPAYNNFYSKSLKSSKVKLLLTKMN